MYIYIYIYSNTDYNTYSNNDKSNSHSNNNREQLPVAAGLGPLERLEPRHIILCYYHICYNTCVYIYI